MHPILFTIGPFTVYTYGVMLAVAVLVCSYLLSRDAMAYNMSRDASYDLVFWCLVGGIMGARVAQIFIEWPYYSRHLWETVMLQKGGLAWHGGFLGGFLAGLWFVCRRKLKLRFVLDLVSPYLALGQAIGRIGCFFNGCCYGKPVSWGIYFPSYEARLHPTQLYETAALLAIFIILTYARNLKHRPGFIFILYLLLASVERFVVEFYRADHAVLYLGFSLAQYITLGIFVFGLILMKAFKR